MAKSEKDTFYFPHDYNTRNNPKVKKLIQKHGITGFGIYWAIVEDLYNNANALPSDYESIAYDLHVEVSIIHSVVNDFELFIVKNGKIISDGVRKRLKKRKEKSQKARKSAIEGWSKRNAIALQTHSDSNAIKGKERKGKESKSVSNTLEQKIENLNSGSISDFKDQLLTDEVWQMQSCTALGIDKKSIEEALKKFIIQITAAPETYDNLDSCKKHFIHWHKKNHGKNNSTHSKLKSDSERQSTSPGDGSGHVIRYGGDVQKTG